MSSVKVEVALRLSWSQIMQHMNSSTIVINVEPVGCRFRATLDGRVIVSASSTPFLDAARILIATGCDQNITLAMFHVGAAEPALTGPIGVAARLDVKDARFVRYRPRDGWAAKADASLTDRAKRVGRYPT